MTHTPDPFAALRALLAQQPSSSRWEAIVTRLRAWPTPDQHLAIDYAQQHMAHWPDALRHADAFAPNDPLWPLVRSLQLDNSAQQAALALFQTTTAQLTMLSLPGILHRGAHVTPLCKATSLSRVHTLRLHNNKIQLDQCIQHICDAPFAASLRALYIDHNYPGFRTLQGLIEAGIMAQLHTFSTNATQLWDERACRELQSVASGALRELHIQQCGMTDRQFAALLDAPLMQGVEALYAARNHISANSLEALATTKHLQHLKILDIRRNTRMSYIEYRLIDDESVYQLLSSPVGQQLESLWLDPEQLSPECQAYVKERNQGQEPPL